MVGKAGNGIKKETRNKQEGSTVIHWFWKPSAEVKFVDAKLKEEIFFLLNLTPEWLTLRSDKFIVAMIDLWSTQNIIFLLFFRLILFIHMCIFIDSCIFTVSGLFLFPREWELSKLNQSGE